MAAERFYVVIAEGRNDRYFDYGASQHRVRALRKEHIGYVWLMLSKECSCQEKYDAKLLNGIYGDNAIGEPING